MVFAQDFDPFAGRGSGEAGERVAPRDLIGNPLLVNVREFKTGVVTKFKPDGTSVVMVDVCGVGSGRVARDQAWWNPAVVDSLAPYAGQVVPCKLVWVSAKGTGRAYIAVEALTGDELAQARTLYQGGDPFRDADPTAPAAPAAVEAAPAPQPPAPGGASAARW